MLFTIRHNVALVVSVGVIAAGLLSGCTVTIPEPKVTPATPTIPVDTSKSIDQQMEELETGFKKLYCPVRESPIADAIIDDAKKIWNDIAARAKKDGLPIPAFDPHDPKMCRQ